VSVVYDRDNRRMMRAGQILEDMLYSTKRRNESALRPINNLLMPNS